VQYTGPEKATGIDDMQEELSASRMRAQTEIAELNKLTDEISKQRSILQRELKNLKKQIKRVRRKTDDD